MEQQKKDKQTFWFVLYIELIRSASQFFHFSIQIFERVCGSWQKIRHLSHNERDTKKTFSSNVVKRGDHRSSTIQHSIIRENQFA